MVPEEVQRRHHNREMFQTILDREHYSENGHNGTGNFVLLTCMCLGVLLCYHVLH